MNWLMRILATGKKGKKGFTLIELMVVVIVVGILAAAAIPIYRFAMSRAYSSEAKATMGTMMSSMKVFYTENEGVYPPEVFGTSTTTATTDIMTALGVNTSTNTWWHAGMEDLSTAPVQTCKFGTTILGTWPDESGISTPTSSTGPFVWARGDVETVKTIYGIKLVYDMGADKWYTSF